MFLMSQHYEKDRIHRTLRVQVVKFTELPEGLQQGHESRGCLGGSLEWQNLAINPPANQDMENPNIKLDQIRWVFPSSATFAKPLFRASLDPLEALEPRLWCASPHQLQDHSAFGLHDRCLAKAVAQAGTTTGSIAGNRWLWEGRYPMI